MSVQWTPTTNKVPVADYREFFRWQESERYKELVEESNDRIAQSQRTGENSATTLR